jgi:hypothetical protein
MPARQSISLLVLSLLIALPAGIASAGNDVDIQSPNSRVTVTDDGNVRIRSNPPSTNNNLIVPTSRVRNQILLRSLRYPQYSQYSQCSGSTYSRQINHVTRYGDSVNHTYTSSTTKSCQ